MSPTGRNMSKTGKDKEAVIAHRPRSEVDFDRIEIRESANVVHCACEVRVKPLLPVVPQPPCLVSSGRTVRRVDNDDFDHRSGDIRAHDPLPPLETGILRAVFDGAGGGQASCSWWRLHISEVQDAKESQHGGLVPSTANEARVSQGFEAPRFVGIALFRCLGHVFPRQEQNLVWDSFDPHFEFRGRERS
jgi:hypothetical protein